MRRPNAAGGALTASCASRYTFARVLADYSTHSCRERRRKRGCDGPIYCRRAAGVFTALAIRISAWRPAPSVLATAAAPHVESPQLSSQGRALSHQQYFSVFGSPSSHATSAVGVGSAASAGGVGSAASTGRVGDSVSAASSVGSGLIRAATSVFVALGVLSSATTFETDRASAAKCRLMRERVRAARAYATSASVALRFLLSDQPAPQRSASGNEKVRREMAEAHAEAAVTGDIVFLNMTESFHRREKICACVGPRGAAASQPYWALTRLLAPTHRCAWKHVLWYRYALVAFPSAAFIALADNDAFISIAHLEADLRAVRSLTAPARGGEPEPMVLWGLILWKPYYNQVTYEPANEFSGWGFSDYAAASLRERLEACRDVLNESWSPLAWQQQQQRRQRGARRGRGRGRGGRGRQSQGAGDSSVGRSAQGTDASREAARLSAWEGMWRTDAESAALVKRHRCHKLTTKQAAASRRMDSMPPYPFANGPLFAVSRKLGEAMAWDAVPTEWMRGLEGTETLQFYFKKGRVPYTLRGSACYPASFDAINGRWLYEIAAKSPRAQVTLVNTPFMVQHHPWLAFHHGAFSNSSIVLHELKNPNSPGWSFAAARGTGSFVPFERECATCEAMGWSTVPGSSVGAWRCCGSKMNDAQVKHACRSRARCVLPSS